MSNPVLNNSTAEKYLQQGENFEAMTISGTVLKTTLLLAILILTSSVTFSLVLKGFIDKAMMLGGVGIFGGLIVAMIIIFSKNTKITAPLSLLYSGLEGLAIGGISALFVAKYGGGIVANAVCATFAVLFSMLFLYAAKIIKCTEKFMGTVIAATFGVLVIYLISFVVSFFNPGAASLLMGNGPFGIGFSVVVCLIAAFNFIIDFHTIENAKNMGLTKDFEWYGAFSLMVTLIWLYIEILKLLAKLNSRR